MEVSRSVERIAPEVLSSIFRCLRDLLEQRCRGLLPVTHTCRQWRAAAVEDPFLWNTITDRNPERAWLELLLRRSKSCALTVIISIKWTHPDACLILSQAHRIATLNIAAPHLDVLQAVEESLAGPLPALVDLELSLRNDTEEYNLTLELAGRAPNLRTFTCNGFVCSHEWDFLSKLTSFTLAGQGYRTKKLARMLTAIPQLQELTLVDALEEDEQGSTITDLPCLQRLVLSDDAELFEGFFSCFQIPRECNFIGRPRPLIDGSFALDDFQRVPHLIARYHASYTYLSLRFDGRGTTLCVGSNAYIQQTGCPEVVLLLVNQYPMNVKPRDGQTTPDALAHAAMSITQMFPTQDLSEAVISLAVQKKNALTMDQWLGFLMQLPNLRGLTVELLELRAFLDAMCPKISHDAFVNALDQQIPLTMEGIADLMESVDDVGSKESLPLLKLERLTLIGASQSDEAHHLPRHIVLCILARYLSCPAEWSLQNLTVEKIQIENASLEALGKVVEVTVKG